MGASKRVAEQIAQARRGFEIPRVREGRAGRRGAGPPAGADPAGARQGGCQGGGQGNQGREVEGAGAGPG